jgi:hypothetical protein
VLAVIRRLRERGLPDTLDQRELTRLGIPAGNAPRTLQALRFLRLVDDEGRRTAIFDRLGRASTSEYPEQLGEIITAAYASVFKIIDPAQATDVQLHDAFRHFHPEAQRARMVVLFMGLCREAGLVEGGPPERVVRAKPTRSNGAGGKGNKPTPPPNGRDAHAPLSSHTDGAFVGHGAGDGTGDEPAYQLMMALIRQLPADRKWTKERRDKWLQAVTVNVDLLVDVVGPEPPHGSNFTGDDRSRPEELAGRGGP